MRFSPIALVLFLMAFAGALADPAHVQNSESPAQGVQVLSLQEKWHRGDDEDDLIFGAIRNVSLGPDGNLYVLDTQQSQVAVFDGEGQFLRYLSREGEGPGECRRPEDLVFFPDGNLGIAQYLNGRIIKIDLQGIPVSTLMPPVEGGAMSSIRRARYRAGTFVINGVKVQQLEDGIKRTQYLVRCDDEANPLVEYLSRSASANLMRDGWVEKDNYFPSHERWDIDAEGRVVAATERNEYLITVFDPDGAVVFTFGRDHQPWVRTEAEKQEIRDSLTAIRDGQRVEVEVFAEDNEPAIRSLFCRPDGEIWVLTGAGTHDQPPGIMQTYDVFSSAGIFLRKVALEVAGDPEEDTLFLLDGGCAALVRGAVQARRNAFGGSRGEEKEISVHDLLVFTF